MRDLKGKIIGITPGRDAAYARVVKLLRDNGMDPAKDVTFLSVGDGGPAARVAAHIERGDHAIDVHATVGHDFRKGRHANSSKN